MIWPCSSVYIPSSSSFMTFPTYSPSRAPSLVFQILDCSLLVEVIFLSF